MRTKTNLFLLLAIVLFVCSCGSQDSYKSRIKEKIENSSSKEDVTIKVTDFGQLYGVAWGLDKEESKLTQQLGEKRFNQLSEKSIAIVAPFAASELGDVTIDIDNMKKKAKDIDNTLSKCDVKPTSYFTIVKAKMKRGDVGMTVDYAVLVNDKNVQTLILTNTIKLKMGD